MRRHLSLRSTGSAQPTRTAGWHDHGVKRSYHRPHRRAKRTAVRSSQRPGPPALPALGGPRPARTSTGPSPPSTRWPPGFTDPGDTHLSALAGDATSDLRTRRSPQRARSDLPIPGGCILCSSVIHEGRVCLEHIFLARRWFEPMEPSDRSLRPGSRRHLGDEVGRGASSGNAARRAVPAAGLTPCRTIAPRVNVAVEPSPGRRYDSLRGRVRFAHPRQPRAGRGANPDAASLAGRPGAGNLLMNRPAPRRRILICPLLGAAMVPRFEPSEPHGRPDAR